jgi:hypothetical protein
VVEEGRIFDVHDILRDQPIEFTGYYSRKRCPDFLRRIEVGGEKEERTFLFYPIIFAVGSTTIARLYKQRGHRDRPRRTHNRVAAGPSKVKGVKVL